MNILKRIILYLFIKFFGICKSKEVIKINKDKGKVIKKEEYINKSCLRHNKDNKEKDYKYNVYIPTCGYMLFSNMKRKEITDKLIMESNNKKIGAGVVFKKLGKLWKELPIEERIKYNERAKKLNREMKRIC